ncbi:MAG TPA: hypothetical protein VM328_12930, partial [Fimbriimonadaceae bacterium]|nr:hypothetical protein [Fimbriimonadaceae bacterium]
ADGKPISGVTQVLELEPATSGADAAQEPPGASTARLVRGRSGALDLAAAIEYEAWHRRIARWVSRLRDRADDPDRLESELRRAEIALRAAAVQDADEASRSLSSGRSRIEAEWRRARATWAGSVQDPEPLVKVDAGKEDFVRVMTGGRHFTHSDGRAFIPIGYNHNPDWTTLRHSDPDAESYDPKVTDRWFQNLKDHGVNLVRLMIETPTSGNLEETIGVLEPEHVLWLDNVFLAARKHGVKLMVTPYDTFWMNQRWDTTHYNPALGKGGMIHEKIQFITSRQAIEAQKRRLRFLVDRYGNLGEVFCWEILNEADIWWGATPAQLKAWSDDIVSFLKAYQKKKWGRTHLVTMSFAEGMPKAELAELAFREPGYDLATTHLYVGITKAPKSRDDAIGAGLAIGRGVRHALSEIRDARPYIDGENGPIDDWIEDEKLDDEVFHAMSWGHLCSGGSGSSLRWPYRNPHHLTPGMLRYLKSMRAFVDGVDWRSMTGPVRSEELTGTGVAGVQVTTDRASLVWLMGRGGMPPVVRLKDFEGQHYRMFDTRLGKWLASGTLSGELRAPAGVDSIALHIVKRR